MQHIEQLKQATFDILPDPYNIYLVEIEYDEGFKRLLNNATFTIQDALVDAVTEIQSMYHKHPEYEMVTLSEIDLEDGGVCAVLMDKQANLIMKARIFEESIKELVMH